MNFNQFRRRQLENDGYEYLNPITEYTFNENTQSQSALISTVYFKDPSIKLSDGNFFLPTEDNGVKTRNYFLRVKIYKNLNASIKYSIILINTEKKDDNTQLIEKIEVEKGESNDYSIFDIVIAPNNNYNQILFEMERETEDFKIENIDGTYGKVTKIEVVRLDEIFNIINYLDKKAETKIDRLLQLGVQSKPGLLMCINREAIKVGKSGLYEINEEYKITFLGFIVEPYKDAYQLKDEYDKNEYFILDYQY